MATLFIAIAVGIGSFAALFFAADFGIVWSLVLCLLAFFLVNGVTGYFIQKRMKADMMAVQKILLNGQKQLQAKMETWRFRPVGSMAEAKHIVDADSKVFVNAALKEVDGLVRYRPWVPMIDRQIATARLQLCWMIKDFKEVDRLLPKALFIDPTMSAMKMARMYSLGTDLKEIGKVYEKAVRRVRYNGNVLLAATWSWMLVQKGDLDGAFKALTEALKKSDNETLKRNHECLMNNRPAHFNNSGIGETWYSLFLEEPKMHAPRQRPVYR